jgi:hypothetical protein
LVEQRLGAPQIGGIEILGELLVDFSEHRTRLLAGGPKAARGLRIISTIEEQLHDSGRGLKEPAVSQTEERSGS